MQNPESYEAQLETLKKAYAQKLPYRIEQITLLYNALKTGQRDEGAYEALHRLLHALLGSGTTFGYGPISQSAHTLEQLIGALEHREAQPDEAFFSRCDEALEALKHAATLLPTPITLPEATPAPKRSNGQKRLLYLAEDDTDLAKKLSGQLGYYDYEVRLFSSVRALMAAIQTAAPSVVITESELPDGSAAHALKQLPDAARPGVLLFIARRGDLKARLGAVRAGSAGYFIKPLSPARLIDRLEEITAAKSETPPRILVVDDSKTLGQLYALILRRFGMDAAATDNPERVLEAIEEHQPEMVLLDMYMSGFSGDEIAKVIRQHEHHANLPILFLSAESDLHKQLSALASGADDFLLKPIEPAHLALAVRSRVFRSRQLRALMVRDSLTGLYNHTETKKQLDLLLERAKRAQQPLSFAMIDIDRFKRVNDTYGHPVGDRVIKSLSRLLQRRLRKGDVVGRYGGEEFAVILPDTDAAQAKKLLDTLRESFSELLHQTERENFNCTFSVGIAHHPAITHPAKLIEAADGALYAAKEAGRNRVVIHAESSP